MDALVAQAMGVMKRVRRIVSRVMRDDRCGCILGVLSTMKLTTCISLTENTGNAEKNFFVVKSVYLSQRAQGAQRKLFCC